MRSSRKFQELFKQSGTKSTKTLNFPLSEDQLSALKKMELFATDLIASVFVLQGYAGTGKTTVLNTFIKYLDQGKFDYCLCAPTHKAKLNMEEITGKEAVTIHKLLSLAPNLDIFNLDMRELEFKSGGLGQIPDNGIVIIDECSMVTDELFELLLKLCKSCDTKVLFVGDKAQLQGVGEKSVSKVFSCENSVSLTKIHRQGADNGLLPLLKNLREKPMPRFKPISSENGSLFVYNSAKTFMLKSMTFITDAVKRQDVTGAKLIAYTNSRVDGFNKCVRRLMWENDNQFNQFEFLTGYDNIEYNHNKFYNSLDYIIVEKPTLTERIIPHFMKLPGYSLELYDTIYKEVMDIFVLSDDISQIYLDSLAQKIEKTRIEAIEADIGGNKTKSKMLWRFYYEMVKSFGITKDLMWDNRVIKRKTFDYGYASTIHKIQGSSLKTILVDMGNVLSCRNPDEVRQMQYVSLSRTRNDAHILIN